MSLNLTEMGFLGNFKLKLFIKDLTDLAHSLIGETSSVWTIQHKEALKRYLLLFGFSRWTKIRKVSDILSKVPFESLKFYALSFIKMLLENLPRDSEQDLRNFLIYKLNSCPLSNEEQEGVCSSDIKNWGGDKIQNVI